MSLQSILADMPDVSSIVEEVAISERFKDKDGKLLKFKIKAMTQADFSRIKRLNTKTDKKGNSVTNDAAFNSQIIVEHCLEPNFKDSELLSSAGCQTPAELINKKLTAGEILALSNAISHISGFSVDIEELNEEIKNC